MFSPCPFQLNKKMEIDKNKGTKINPVILLFSSLRGRKENHATAGRHLFQPILDLILWFLWILVKIAYQSKRKKKPYRLRPLGSHSFNTGWGCGGSCSSSMQCFWSQPAHPSTSPQALAIHRIQLPRLFHQLALQVIPELTWAAAWAAELPPKLNYLLHDFFISRNHFLQGT